MFGIVISLWLIAITLLVLFQPALGPVAYYLIVWMHPEEQMYGGLSLRWTFLIALTSLIGFLFMGKGRQVPKSSLVIFVILLMLWYFASALVNDVTDEEFSLATDFAKVVLMSLITACVMNTRARIHTLIWIIVISIGMVSLRTGLITIVSAGGAVVIGPDFLGHTNEYARFVIYTWPLMIFLSRHSAHYYVRVGFAALSVISVLALIGTNSRGALVAFAAMCGVLWLFQNKKIRIALLASLLAMGAYFAAPEKRMESFSNRAATIENADEDTSFVGRTEAWVFGWDYALDHPIFGGGPNIFERVHKTASHSNYFEVLGETGFVGLTIYGVIAILAFATILRIRKLTKGIPDLIWAHDLAFFIMISLVGYFVGGLVKNHGFNEYYYMLLGILMGTEVAVRNYLIAHADGERQNVDSSAKNAPAQVYRN